MTRTRSSISACCPISVDSNAIPQSAQTIRIANQVSTQVGCPTSSAKVARGCVKTPAMRRVTPRPPSEQYDSNRAYCSLTLLQTAEYDGLSACREVHPRVFSLLKI